MIDDEEDFVEGEQLVLDQVDELQKEFDRINSIEDEEERLQAAKLLMGRLANG